MRNGRILNVEPTLLSLGLLGALAFTGGCGGDSGGSGGPPSAEAQALQDADRQARENAYGKSGYPGKTKPKKSSVAPRTK